MTSSITLGTKTISSLVKDVQDCVEPIKSSWIAFEDEKVFEKTKYYGTIRMWTLTIVEEVATYSNSLHSYLLALAGTGNTITFSYSSDNYSVSATVYVDSLDFNLSAEGKNPPHRYSVELREYQS